MPYPGQIPRTFLITLEKSGIPSGRYNLPSWQNGPAGKEDKRPALSKSTLVRSGTIGPLARAIKPRR